MSRIERPYIVLALLCLPIFVVAAFTPWHWEITPDDSYYYFAVARELVDTGKLSFDGTTLASGYHPLWLAICAVVYSLAGDALPQAINGVALICYGIYAAFFYFSLIRLALTETARLVLFAFAVVNAPIAFMAFSGMETSLVLASAAAFFYVALRTMEAREFPAIWLGAAAAILFLARLDTVLLVAPLLTWLSLREFRRLFVPMSLFASFIVLYMAASMTLFGSPVPSSTTALRLIWYPIWHQQQSPWMNTGYFWDFPGHIVSAIQGFYWDIKTALGVSGFLFDRSWPAHILVPALVILSLLGLRRPIEKWGARRQVAVPRIWFALLLSVGVAIYLYATVVRLGGVRSWYLQAPAFLSIAAVALLVSARPEMWRPPVFLLGLQIGIYIISVPGYVTNSWLPLDRASVAREAKETAANGKIGAFNAGIYGWGARGIVNLDGLVNQEGYAAIRDRRMSEYLRRSGITHILEVEEKERFLSTISRLSRKQPPRVVLVREWPDQNGFTHRLYRLRWE